MLHPSLSLSYLLYLSSAQYLISLVYRNGFARSPPVLESVFAILRNISPRSLSSSLFASDSRSSHTLRCTTLIEYQAEYALSLPPLLFSPPRLAFDLPSFFPPFQSVPSPCVHLSGPYRSLPVPPQLPRLTSTQSSSLYSSISPSSSSTSSYSSCLPSDSSSEGTINSSSLGKSGSGEYWFVLEVGSLGRNLSLVSTEGRGRKVIGLRGINKEE